MEKSIQFQLKSEPLQVTNEYLRVEDENGLSIFSGAHLTTDNLGYADISIGEAGNNGLSVFVFGDNRLSEPDPTAVQGFMGYTTVHIADVLPRHFIGLSTGNYQLSTPFSPVGSFQLKVSIYTDDTSSEQWIVGKWVESSEDRSYALRIKNNIIQFFISTDGTNYNVVDAPFTQATGLHEIVCTFNSGVDLSVSVDGVSVVENTTITSVNSNSSPTVFGFKSGIAGNEFTGIIANPSFIDLDTPANNLSYKMDNETENSEIDNGVTLNYNSIPESQREEYEFNGVDTWLNISEEPQSLPQELTIPNPTIGYDIILLIGQSNMVGRASPIDPVLDDTDSLVDMYGSTSRDRTRAADPLDHLDEIAGQMGLGLTLGKAYASQHLINGRKVLLVPAADGGTSFGSGFWREGGVGYENAINRANEALGLGDGSSRIVLMAWHQGESDMGMTESQYASEIDTLISDFRSKITGASNSPFIVGEVSPDSAQYGAGVAAAILDTPNRNTSCGYVQTSDLDLNGDSLHFTAPSLRTMGERYMSELNTLL